MEIKDRFLECYEIFQKLPLNFLDIEFIQEQLQTRVFVDPNFPPTDDLFVDLQGVKIKLEWKRPHDVFESTYGIYNRMSEVKKVKTGALSGSWLTSAIALLTER